MKIVAFHGMSRSLEDLWLPALKEDLKGKNIEIIAPTFPMLEDITLEKWFEIADKLKDQIDKDTVFICHSLATNFIFKYMYKNKLKCKAIIAVAGGYSKRLIKFTHLAAFKPYKNEIEYTVANSKYRYAIHSDKDGTWLDSEVRRYDHYFKGEVIVIPGAAHFGLRSGVKKIPELTEIINKLEKAD